MSDSFQTFAVLLENVFDGPEFGSDDAELLREQEARQLRFRELDFDELSGSRAPEQATGLQASLAPDTDLACFREIPEALSLQGDVPEPVVTRDLDSGMDWEGVPFSGSKDDATLWDSDLSDEYSLDEIREYLAPDIRPDELTREQRALQVAAEVAGDCEWDRAGIALLAAVFERHWWSASQVAVRRAIENGMTQRELLLADSVRQMWSERSEFWVAQSYGTTVQRYSLLTWPAALSLIRSFEGYPDTCEVEQMLDGCLTLWLRSSNLQWRFRSFLAWALYRCGARGDMPEFDGWVDFGSCPGDDDDMDDPDLLRELRSCGLGIGPRWQPPSRGLRFRERDGLNRGFDATRRQIQNPDTESEC